MSRQETEGNMSQASPHNADNTMETSGGERGRRAGVGVGLPSDRWSSDHVALLAEFAALAASTSPPTTTLPVPTPSPRPWSYLDAVVSPHGRGYTSLALPSPSVMPSQPSAAALTPPTVGKR